MSLVTPRERLIRRLFDMTDEQITTLEAYAEAMSSSQVSPDYDPETDPLIDLLEGPTDLSLRAKEILHREFGMKKKD